MFRSTYQAAGGTRSNIVWNPSHVSIPRHLRDIVITEYGTAELRGKSDEETIIALLNITDSRFQQDLLKQAQNAGKVSASYRIPEAHRQNTPERVARFAAEVFRKKYFQPFPFGSDWTREEEKIVLALQKLKNDGKESKMKVAAKLLSHWSADARLFSAELRRMDLETPRDFKERLNQKLLVAYLS
jgi:hypothetical protein